MRGVLFLLCAGLLSACTSYKYVSVDTRRPAEITFPKEVAQVLIVNNAIPQPSKVGYEYNLLGVRQDTARALADSALFDACRALGKAILDADYFQDVLLFQESTRADDSFFADTRLDKEVVDSLCEETGADAVISLDKLLFVMEKNIVALGGGYTNGIISVKMAGTLRAYLPGRETPVAKILLADSLEWEDYADGIRALNKILPSPEEALRVAGTYIGETSYPNFVPYWRTETRWYYSVNRALWKQAAAYADSGKWDSAEKTWQTIYEKAEKTAKAKAAFNIALALEMKGETAKAYEWGEKAVELFESASGKESENYHQSFLYSMVLKKRAMEVEKLNMQIGAK